MNRYKYIDNEENKHLHTLDGRPLIGTSSVVKVIPPPLAYYASGLAVKEFGVPDPKVLTKFKNKKATEDEITELKNSCRDFLESSLRGIELDDYIKLLTKAYNAHSTNLKKTAKEGTELHKELEIFIKDWMEGNFTDKVNYSERIEPFIEWSNVNVNRFIWSEAHCYSEKLWIGGISDVGVELNDGRIGIMDFKSSPDAYKTQFWQCCGYAIEIEENGLLDKNGYLIGKLDKPIEFVSVVPFGAEIVEPKFYYDILGGKQAFEALLLLYKKLN